MNSGKVIWKYPLHSPGWPAGAPMRHTVEMPMVSVVLCLQLQGETPTLWVQVDPTSSVVARTFEWVLTGREVPHGGRYIGTAQFWGGSLVKHLYEVTG